MIEARCATVSGTAPERPVALVTGASSGIGSAIARALAGAGYDLALADLSADMVDTLSTEMSAAGSRVTRLSLDLRDERSVSLALGSVADAFGRCDLLVNNAGRSLVKPASDVTWDEWDEVLDVNLKGAFFLSQALARRCLGEGRPGAIVNIASTHGITGLPGRSVYGASKGGLIQLTRMLAVEWAPHDIRVNAIAPATVLTPSRMSALPSEDSRRRMLARIPAGRFPQPAEVGAAVVYPAGSGAASVTGHVLVLDGGLTAA